MAHSLRRRLIVVAVVGTLGTGGCGSAARRGTPLPADTPPTTSTPAGIEVGWERSPAAGLDLGGGPTSKLSAVIAPQEAGGDWLIVGTRLAADGTTTATVWSSNDGLRWTSTALAGTDGRALAASAWGTRTVIVGSLGRGSTERAAVWVTAGPGQAFDLVPADAAMLATSEPTSSRGSTGAGTGVTGPTGAGTGVTGPTGAGSTGSGSAVMDLVSAGPQGVVAAGSVSGREAVWYSTDGTDWVRVAGAERLIDRARSAVVTALLATPGGVLAAGTVRDGTQIDGAIWTSADGITWQRFSADDNPFAGAGDHRIDGLTLNSAGSLIAVGAVRSGSGWIPASWISPSGGTWSEASEALPTWTEPQAVAGGTVVRSVATTATSPGLVAVGGSSTAQRLWTSSDGQSWTEVPLPADAARASDWSADLVATNGSTSIVVDDAPGQPRVLVRAGSTWQEVSAQTSIFGPVAPTATPAALVEDGRQMLLAVDIDRQGPSIGPATTSVEVLASADAVNWRRLSEAGALTGGWFDSMSIVSGAIVAAGWSTTPTGGTVATVWTSATGRQWEVAGALDDSAAPTSATTVAALGTTLVAAGVGPSGPDAAVDATPVAQAWSGEGGRWRSTGTLDPTPTSDAEEPLATCSNGPTLVVVGDSTRQGIPSLTRSRPRAAGSSGVTTTVAVAGSPAGPDGQGSDGTVARTWATSTGTAWTGGTVSPLSGAGGDEAMDGCTALGSGWVAWGETPGPQGQATPALWTSPDSATWTLESRPALTSPGVAPLTDVTIAGKSWVAVGGGNLAATVDPDDPTATADDPVLGPALPSSSGPDGDAGVWSSVDGGRTWHRVLTAGPAWTVAGQLRTDLVGLLGSSVVVVGEANNRLAVWTGQLVTTAGTTRP